MNPFRRNRRLRRPTLWLAVGLFATLVLPWTAFQLESVFGRAGPTTACAEPAVAPDPAPLVTFRTDLPPLHAVAYNLHSGLGSGRLPFASRRTVEANLRAIAGHIAAAGPADVVGLNEVDFDSRRSGWLDQADFVAGELKTLTGYSYAIVRGETWRRDVPGLEVRFGNALLVRHPLLSQRTCRLGAGCVGAAVSRSAVGPFGRLVGEPRGVVQARIDFHGQPVDVLVSHLEAFVPAQREVQAAELLRRFVDAEVPTLLLGDVNAVPAAVTGARRHFSADRTHDVLTSGALVDARAVLAPRDPAAWPTYPAERPEWPLDGAFATAHLLPGRIGVIGGRESDHRGLAVRFEWPEAAGRALLARWHDGVRRRQLARILACDLGPTAPARAERAGWVVNETGYRELMGGTAVP